ncbi:hypothetical protein J6A32_10410 [Methanocorpusculum sp.]|nr:hypothetical protein [Methanocorpusculum sp.]
MATQIIDFNIELAKKIASGEERGKIKTRDDCDVQILTFDAHLHFGFCIVALYLCKDGCWSAETYKPNGSVSMDNEHHTKDLIIEVPIAQEKESAPFKPFDKVLIRDNDNQYWKADLFSNIRTGNNEFPYCCVGNSWKQCIPYEGNEQLLGKIDKPKED